MTNDKITTYPEMNQQIAGILRVSDDYAPRYAAQYIEELQAEVEWMRQCEEGIRCWAEGEALLRRKAEAEVERLRAKQTEYVDALMGMVCQHCQIDKPDLYMTMGLSANEDAIGLLEDDGLAERLPGKLWRWRLCWDKLNRD